MSKAWQTPVPGGTRAWRKKRKRVLTRDSWLCQLKVKGKCEYRADCVHHVLGKGVSDRDEDLVAACTPCNLHIGDPRRFDPAPRPKAWWK